MSITAVSSSFRVNTAQTLQIYEAAALSSYSLVNLIIYNPDTSLDATYSVAYKTDASAVVSDDRFIETMTLGPGQNHIFQHLMVGPEHKLIVTAHTGTVNARVHGGEYVNPNVQSAGLLAAVNCPNGVQTATFENTSPNTVATSVDIIVKNINAGSAFIRAYIAQAAGPATEDFSFLRQEIPADFSVIFDRIIMSPNEYLSLFSESQSTRAYVFGMIQEDTP